MLWLTGLLFFGLGGGLAVLFYIDRQGGVSGSTAVFEEFHIRPSPTQEHVGRIDRTVYETLDRQRIREKNIHFTDVGYRTCNGDVWDFTEITVRFQDAASMRLVREELLSKISALDPSVECWIDAEPSEGIAFRVYAGNRYTHRICLVIDKTPSDPLPTKRRLPRVAIIIDDLGQDSAKARAFTSLGIPVALSVLPMSSHTGEIAREAARIGADVMLHFPMEPKGYPEVNPGPGAIFRSMEPQEIRKLVRRHLNEVPEAVGVNNHMGSSFTEDHDGMVVFLEEIGKSGLFFVDSKTSPRSVAYGLARKMGVASTVRDVFLDNDPSATAIGIQIERLMGRAKLHGEAVGIGHPFAETLKVLKGEEMRLRREAEVVPISELVR